MNDNKKHTQELKIHELIKYKAPIGVRFSSSLPSSSYINEENGKSIYIPNEKQKNRTQ